LQIYDTEGSERSIPIIKHYCKTAHAYIVLYDITNFYSYVDVNNWIKIINENTQENSPIVLAGTKCDLDERCIKTEIGEKCAEKFGIKFYEISAKTGDNCNKIFSDLTEVLLSSKKGNQNQGDKSDKSFWNAKCLIQ